MEIESKIWNVESSCDGLHDGEVYFTLSFVTPEVSTNPEVSKDSKQEFSGIVTPFNWHLPYKINIEKSNQWNLVYLDADSKDAKEIKVSKIAVSFINMAIDDSVKIRNIFKAKLKDAIKDQEKPYSTDSLIASQRVAGKSTLPHELAGLNQLPKTISEFLFEATVTVKFEQNLLPENIYKIIGLYPCSFKIDNEVFTYDSFIPPDPKQIISIKYNSDLNPTLPLTFKDIVQDVCNRPQDVSSEKIKSIISLNDPSVAGRLGILARNLNAFRILSISLRKLHEENEKKDPKIHYQFNSNEVASNIYNLLLRGVLRVIVDPKDKDKKPEETKNILEWFTVFDPSFATGLELDRNKLDNLKEQLLNRELTGSAKDWLDNPNNKLNKEWTKLDADFNLNKLADFMQVLADESIKEVKESSFWVDWLYYVNAALIDKANENEIKLLITTRLQDSHVRDRLALRAYFMKIGADTFKVKLLNCKTKPTEENLIDSLELDSEFKPLTELILFPNISGLDELVKANILKSLITTVNQIYDKSSAQPDDWGIAIKIEDDDSLNKDIRGYSIAICSVSPKDSSTILESVWLTNRKVKWQESQDSKSVQVSGRDLIVDRPEGGYRSKGEQVLSINYYGDATGLSESV